MRNIVLISIAFLGLSFSIFSWQGSKFSGDKTLYIEELEDFMSNVSEKHEETLERFIRAWEKDSLFSDIEQENIIRLSQKMVKRKARPYPQFVTFLSCMLAIEETNVLESNYINWVNGMDKFLDKRKTSPTKINVFLSFSNTLFRENLIAKSSSTRWRASSNDYEISVGKDITVVFEKTDLICYTRADSVQLFNTSGSVNPLENVWIGKDGLVTWERGGYSRDEIYANLSEYEINLKKSEYKAQNVVFTNKRYFEESIKGEIHDKVKRVASVEKATYPRFYSYEKTFNIENIYKGVNYLGGVSMQGSKMIGTGSIESPARISIFRNDTLVLESSSLYFGFKRDKVVSEKTSISIKLKQDSIYHPDLFFDFRTDKRELILLKTESFSSKGPYTDSYHNIEMNFDQLVWRIDEDYMRFTASKGASIGNAYFESVNYFNFDKYINMQMMDQVHPLLSIRSFARKYGREEFPVEAYASYLGISTSQVKHVIMRLAFEGFVYYDNNTGRVSIKPRTHTYIAASVNKVDYDVIGFNSVVQSPLENAVFDIRNNDLIINGIPKIQVSDSQNVIIYPKNARIILKENRNFQFDGVVEAGLMTFNGSNLFFHYDSFKINMQMVDAVEVDYLTGDLDNYGLEVVGSIDNMIRSLTGDLLIDRNDNKSGRISYPDYPVFRSKEISYVYYDSPSVFGNVYDANDFYFAVDPFEMDSLDNFNAYAMVYEGEFVSAGILPVIREKLSLQEDNSLGFVHKTPRQGMSVYGGKGIIYNEISLSNKGLRANGSLDYLTSTTWSDDFQFFPDSMNTLAREFKIRYQNYDTEYPRVESKNNDIHWEPYADVMIASKRDVNFTMFNDSTNLSGNLWLKPSGLSGSGKMDLKNSDLLSDRFTYKSQEIFADTSDFYLKSIIAEGFTVLTENIKSHINYKERKGRFRSNEGYSLVTFPENKYISYIDYFVWDMLKKELSMGSKTKPELPDYTYEDVEPEGPRYISSDPGQDSINFVSPLAFYDYKNNLINATGVKFIDVADSRIYPDKGEVTVNPDYKIKTLVNCWSKVNRFSQYHVLHTATFHIQSRHNYHGMGNYDYVDENGDVQEIHFKEVEVDTGENTKAWGEIFEVAQFKLSPAFRYQGKVHLYATDSLLRFKGNAQMVHTCEKIVPEWIDFETHIDPNSIYIPLEESPRDINNRKLYSSMFMYYDSVHVYPAFLNHRKSYSDIPMLQPKGYLYFDKAQSLYKLGSKEKINNFMLAEDYLSLNKNDCMLYGEGHIDLGNETGQVKLTNFGAFRHDLSENTTEVSLVMAIDFFMDEAMLALMGNEIDSFPNLRPVNLGNRIIQKATNAWVGEEKAAALSEELNLFGTIKELPPELKHTILLNELKVVWNDLTNSYQSYGKIGIASINGIQINKKVDGFFELRIKRSGDIMDLYLQLDRRNYYYFGYTRGVMQTLSHNREYVETIMDMKPKARKMKTKRKSTPYNYLIATDRKKNNFYSRWRNVLEESGENE